MEESKPAENTPTQLPNPPPDTTQPQAPPPPALPPQSKKRPLENNVQIQDSKYFKMRLVVKDVRPHFLEVLRTPDFRNCKASSEIQEQIKIVMEIYKQMTSEKLSITQSLQPDVKAAGQQFQSDVVTEKQQPQDGGGGGGGGETHKSHIVGGSAFGWNFITFSSTEPLYYGVTKESFRTSQTVQEQQDK
ncbi:hypothetical protein LWI29_010202 [Acer saccharum]|uniref:Uncharacterized protein n=1 Tax=Acer saccharum TaxID=4024 RepID=A0AA39RVN7_ACESA|nr:hypothetical protein LWI29_010202 [Acer saccharum]KAK1560562.1 hypothetical protein Q3G72_028064 [Acer saccharum]